jgi:hypothetical protein
MNQKIANLYNEILSSKLYGKKISEKKQIKYSNNIVSLFVVLMEIMYSKLETLSVKEVTSHGF